MARNVLENEGSLVHGQVFVEGFSIFTGNGDPSKPGCQRIDLDYNQLCNLARVLGEIALLAPIGTIPLDLLIALREEMAARA